MREPVTTISPTGASLGAGVAAGLWVVVFCAKAGVAINTAPRIAVDVSNCFLLNVPIM